jgi:anti-sigma regulatory factor (Ser/Thr protein kinase)
MPSARVGHVGYTLRLGTRGAWRIPHRVGLDRRMCLSSAATFPCHATTPQRAREFCLECLRELFPVSSVASDVIDDYLLVVSELTTNAVKAGCTAVSITVEVHRDHLRFAVHDDGPGVPGPGTARRPSDRGGRGLPIVDSLSRAWGVEHQSYGKQVWAEVAVPSGLTLAVDCRL